MKMTLTYTQTFEVGDLTDFQLQTFSGDIEIVGHDENTIKVETFIWDRNLLTFFIVKEFVESTKVGAK